MTKNNFSNSIDGISRWETPQLFEQAQNDDEPQLNEDELRKIAHEEGRKQGYQDGLKQGINDIKQRATTVDALLKALTQPFDDQNNLLAEELALLAGKIAKSLVRRELKTEPEIIMALVRDTVATLNTSVHKINVHLHSDDAKIIRQIIKTEENNQHWTIIDDPAVSRGDCKVISQNSLICADLQTRINLIIIQFLGDDRNESRDEF